MVWVEFIVVCQQDADDKFRNRPAKVKSVPQSKCRVTLTFSDEPNAASVGSVGQSQADMCGGLHEYSFCGIAADDVLEGDIDIRIMDYTSHLLRVQFQCQYGMLAPSYLHCLVTKGEEIPVKIPAGDAMMHILSMGFNL
ncbi:hypothetical protein DPMN_175807 [Dreissena polymorpha]|uniref:Uncharacterized protein n=1 Tax=Dreissena polymorpha TaxID=45954 RepID=A0A9D4IHK0_DREPO|nr:hypothetical protein DPMN_175807 [Dreissena polymorpha]